MKKIKILLLLGACIALTIATSWFYIEFFYEQEETTQALIYEDVDLLIPIEEFLKRGVNSPNLSMVKRALINQWLYFNQPDLIKLIVYAQNSKSYDEIKKALQTGFIKEPERIRAINFLNKTLEKIDANYELAKHVTKSLQEGYPQELHELRAQLINHSTSAYEYKKISNEYRKKLYQWIDKKHGKLIDELIASNNPSAE